MEKATKIARWAIAAAMISMPLMSLAVTVTPPNITTTGAPITLVEIEAIIDRIANFLIVISVIIAVIMIIFGGIKYMTAGGDEKKAGAARTIIFNGIIGAAVVLGVGVILNTLKALLARTFFS